MILMFDSWLELQGKTLIKIVINHSACGCGRRFGCCFLYSQTECTGVVGSSFGSKGMMITGEMGLNWEKLQLLQSAPEGRTGAWGGAPPPSPRLSPLWRGARFVLTWGVRRGRNSRIREDGLDDPRELFQLCVPKLDWVPQFYALLLKALTHLFCVCYPKTHDTPKSLCCTWNLSLCLGLLHTEIFLVLACDIQPPKMILISDKNPSSLLPISFFYKYLFTMSLKKI